MKISPPSDRRRVVRLCALAWVVAAVAIASLQGIQVASALDTGLIGFPSQAMPVVRASRVGEPGLFHAALLGSMLLGFLFLGSAAGAWRLVTCRRALPRAGSR